MKLSKNNAKKVFAALAEENRLKILSLLSKKSLSCDEAEKKNLSKYSCVVGELAKKCNLSIATASHHISQLNNVGLVDIEKRGKSRYCCLNGKNFDKVIAFLEEIRKE